MARSLTLTKEEIEGDERVQEAIARGAIEIRGSSVTYKLGNTKTENWKDPEEWVRCRSIARWIVEKDYPQQRIKIEVQVPRRTPSDYADIVVYRDDRCKDPYAVEECKAAGQSPAKRKQAIEQAFGNGNSLGAAYVVYNDGIESILFDRGNFPPLERSKNQKGTWESIPKYYGEVSQFFLFAGKPGSDIKESKASVLENKIKRAHSLIWAGGKRDPLNAFDEWSKLLFAKVEDERYTKNGDARKFQVGSKDTTAAVANRVHELFKAAIKRDPSVFPDGVRIELPDRKIFDVVRVLQEVSFVHTDADNIGIAFENFFGSVFRGELGQYFTMRPLARFTVAMLDIDAQDLTLDLTSGSGGFLLEVLLQTWHRIEKQYAPADVPRLKQDFALQKVFGIEIHDVLARICKINLMLHHDGHTNIEGDRSCLDKVFKNQYIRPNKFARIVGNPPFGDDVSEGDEDHLGQNHLGAFTVAANRESVASEHVILERAVQFLEPGGRLGLVLPDGVLNNQGEQSNCPQVRRFLAKSGILEAIVSLPDYAFRKSGAQNKTSILLHRRFTESEAAVFSRAFDSRMKLTDDEDDAIAVGLEALRYRVFLAEANFVGYSTTGAASDKNDLYIGGAGGVVERKQDGTILGEYRAFQKNPAKYNGRNSPDCMAIPAEEMWRAHSSRRLDPKYFLFKREEKAITPKGWIRAPLSTVMRRREMIVTPEAAPNSMVKVMTLSQTGEIRAREAGKGRNPPEWLGMYFEDIPSTWFAAKAGDLVFSSIDLWKGCISVVPPDFDGALVTKEFPIYEITDKRLDSDFLSAALRSRYYQRAFRAITTGHSNRRRTQTPDFEALEIVFPADRVAQRALIEEVVKARHDQKVSSAKLKQALLDFSNVIDGRGLEQLPEIDAATSEGDSEAD